MIYESVTTAQTNPVVRNSKLIQEALDWVKRVTPEAEPRRYDLRGDDLYAMVQVRSGSPRKERLKVEVHREYVDLQFCLEGGEFIDWYPLEALDSGEAYNAGNDFQLFDRPGLQPISLLMSPGRFALFFPGDGHVPMVTDGVHTSTRMVVFKIRLKAL